MAYLIFGFGFIIFLPFSIWAVATGVQHTRLEKRLADKRAVELEK